MYNYGRFYLSNEKPIVTIEDFVKTYQNPFHFQAKKTSSFLQRKGLLPLTYNSDLFLKLNILTSFVIWSGGVHIDKFQRPRICLSLDDITENILKENTENLDVEMIKEKARYSFRRNGSPYSRLISVIPGMFISKGDRYNFDRKAYREVTFPDYLKLLSKNFKYIHHNDKNIAKKIIRDNLNVLLLTRFSKHIKGRTGVINLFQSSSKESAKYYCEFALELFNNAYPSLGIDNDSIKIIERTKKYGKRRQIVYKPRIALNEKFILSAVKYSDIFEIRINTNFES